MQTDDVQVQSMCAFMMAMHLSTDGHAWDQGDDLKSFAMAAMVSRMVHCIMYLQVIVMTKKYRNQFIILGISQVVSSILFAISAVYSQHNESYVWLWIAAIITERSITFGLVKHFVPIKNQAPPHFGHLSHRQVTLCCCSDVIYV
jgi:nicotinamide riboside transporter PnuC